MDRARCGKSAPSMAKMSDFRIDLNEDYVFTNIRDKH